MATKRKRPRDTNQLAKLVVDIATHDRSEPDDAPNTQQSAKNPHAVALGRLGGLKGGKARAKTMSAEERSQIAFLAAKTRWSRKK